MKRFTFVTFGLMTAFFLFSYGKCFTDFVDSIVITLDRNNLLTDAYFTIKPAPVPGDQGVARNYSVKEINDSLSSISKKLKLKPVQLQNVVNYTLTSFDLSIVTPSTLKFDVVDYVSLTIAAPGLPDKIIYTRIFGPQANTNSITIPVPQSDVKAYINAAIAAGDKGFLSYRLNLFTNTPVLTPVTLHAVPRGSIELLTQ